MDFQQRPLAGFNMTSKDSNGFLTEASVTDLSCRERWTTLHVDITTGAWRFGKVDITAEFEGEPQTGAVFPDYGGVWSTMTEYEQVTVERILEHLGTLVGKVVQVGNVAPDFLQYTIVAIDERNRGVYLWNPTAHILYYVRNRALIRRFGGYSIVQYR